MGNCYMISGHRDITTEEFVEHYQPRLDKLLSEKNTMFVVGDCDGVDAMAQNYLKENGAKNVIVFHMLETPRNNAGFPTIGGFKDDESRDSAMTDVSDIDILWVREGREGSGTDQNRLRRYNPAGTYVKHLTVKNKQYVHASITKTKKRKRNKK